MHHTLNTGKGSLVLQPDGTSAWKTREELVNQIFSFSLYIGFTPIACRLH